MAETEGLILLFCSLGCFNCWWVGGVGVEQKILFGAGWNGILCVPGSGLDDARSVQNVIFMFLMSIKGKRRVEFKIFYVAPGMEKYSLDLLVAVKNREYVMGMGCGRLFGLWMREICNLELI